MNDAEYGLEEKVAEARRKRDNAVLAKMTKEEREEVKKKHAYVLAVMGLPTTETIVQQAIESVWKKLGSKDAMPSFSSVTRWKNRYIAAGCDALSLHIRHHRKGNRDHRYSEDVIKIVEDAIDQVYLTREKKTVQDVLDHAGNVVELENELLPESMRLPEPSRRLVQGIIDKLDEFDKYAARNGHLAAVKKFRGVSNINLTNRPLQWAEIDHTKVDIMVVDDETGLPLGRPWLTACIDRHTRCVLGIYITFAPPSHLSVSRCLKHAILPKTDLRERYPEIDNEWLAHGVMSKLVVDNGLEFHGSSLEVACLSLGMEIQFTPRKTPWFKGVIERFLGTLNRAIAHGNPGTTFSDIFEKGDYDPVKEAAVTYSTFKLILHKWIVDEYHQKPHKSLDGVTPAVMWERSILPEDTPVPTNQLRMDAILGKSEKRRLTHKGIELYGLSYNSDELIALRRRDGDTLDVDVSVDLGDLGHIQVIPADKSEIFRVRCLQYDYANGLSKWQHDMCKKYARAKLDLADKPTSWRKAKAAIAELVQRDVLRKRRKKPNEKIARLNEENKATPSSAASKAVPETPAVPVAMPVSAPNSTPKKFVAIVESR